MKRIGFLCCIVGPICANLGFAQTDFWRATNGPFGGNVYAVLVSPTGDVFVGTYGGGIFRSTDDGENWTEANNGMTNRYLRSFVANANGHIFAGTDYGIFRSVNGGQSWTAINLGLTTTSTFALAASGDGMLFAGTSGGGVFRSTDNGNVWMPVNAGLTGSYIRALAINPSGHIFAGTQGFGVFRSTNNGDSWAGIGFLNVTVLSLSIDSSGTIFAGTALGGVYRSTNNGDTWSSVGLSGKDVTAIAVNSMGHIFAAFPGIYRSTDGGGTWFGVGALNTSVYGLSIDPSNGRIYAGTYDGVFRSTNNGDTWILTNSGLVGTDVRSVALNAQDVLFAAVDGGMFQSLDNGLNWVQVNNGLSFRSLLSLLIKPNGDIFAGSSAGVFRSRNNGDFWVLFNSGLPAYAPVNFFACDSSGNLLAATGKGVFRSTDGGENWTGINTGLTTTNVLSIVLNSTGHIFVGTSGGGVYRSIDNGGNWSAVNAGLSTNTIQSLAINSSDHVFAGTQSSGVFRSTDNGLTWVQTNMGLPSNSFVRCLKVNSEDYVFACTFNGVFRSTDGGASWFAANSGLTNLNVRTLAFDSRGYAYAGSGGNGVFRTTLRTSAPRIAVTPVSIGFEADSSSGLPMGQTVSLSNTGGSILQWAAIKTQSWLSVNANTGQLREGDSTTVTMSVTTTGLSPGTFSDTIIVADPAAVNSPQKIGVNYVVRSLAKIALSQKTFQFDADSGAAIPGTLAFTLSNSGGGTLSWRIEKTQPWIRVLPDSGTGNSANIVLQITSTELSPRVYRDSLRLTGTKLETGSAALGAEQRLAVSYRIYARPIIVLDKTGLQFVADSGKSLPIPQRFVISNGGEKTLQWNIIKSQAWLSLNIPSVHGERDTIEVRIANSALPVGTYTDTLVISSTSAINSPQKLLVVYRVVRNHPPGNFSLVKPTSYDTLRLSFPPQPVLFRWHKSHDPDEGDTLQYTLCVKGPMLDTTITGLRDTTIFLDIMSVLKPGSSYLCWILATDLFASTSSDTSRYFTSSSVTQANMEIDMSGVSFGLDQNYPNPFNPTTTISFSVAYKSFVSLKVFDAMGREVSILVAVELPAGIYAREWNGASLPSGVYFYRLQAGSFVETKKLVLVK